MKKVNDITLDAEEQWIEDNIEGFSPVDGQDQLRRKMQEAAKSTMAEAKKKKTITINLDNVVIAYFKDMAEDTNIPYQNLINLYLSQCVKENRRLEFV